MKKKLVHAVFALGLLALSGQVFLLTACATPVTVTTPQGNVAYTADQIVVRINELQNAAIAANAAVPPALPTATTRVIVQFCVTADKTLAATPAGWPATLLTAWTATKAQIPAQTNPSILAAISAVDVVLGSVQP